MNELQVKTIELEPAKVVFNHEEIERDLEKNLQKYSGLTFTEDDATECRSTIAELRKGKEAVDEYRKKIKKQLTQPVTEFEDKCKALNKKFDDVINPLVKQNEEFEGKRRNEKRAKVQEVLAQIIEDFELEEKYATQLEILDSYLTKSKTMKSIKEELESNAETLKMKQDKETNDKLLIASTVEIANIENDLNLAKSSYVSLLEFKDVSIIQEQIKHDAEMEVEKRENEKKLQAEKERKKEIIEPEPMLNEKESIPFADPEVLTDPFAENDDFIADPFVEQAPVNKVYEISGTEEQLTTLQEYMTVNGIDWSVIE